MSLPQIVQSAITRCLKHIGCGAFEPESEKDIQALLFHFILMSANELDCTVEVHAEPCILGRKTDLVVGDKAILFELKFSKANTGGYSQAAQHFLADIQKLREYKAAFPKSTCLFLAIDEGTYLSTPSSENYFDPESIGALSKWSSLKTDWSTLLLRSRLHQE